MKKIHWIAQIVTEIIITTWNIQVYVILFQHIKWIFVNRKLYKSEFRINYEYSSSLSVWYDLVFCRVFSAAFQKTVKYSKMNELTSSFVTRISSFLCNTLCFLGLWKPYNESYLKMASYSIYSTVLLFVFPIFYSFFMVCSIFLLTDLSDLSDRLFMSLAETALTIKAINFIMNNFEWQLIFKEIKEFRIKSIWEQQIVTNRHRLFQKITFIYLFNANFYGFLMALIAALNGQMMYSGWYPGFDVQNSRLDFWIVYSFQGIGMAITANMNILLDSYYCFMMFMTSAHLNIFGNRLSSMQMGNSNRSIIRIRNELIEQIHVHQRINANFKLIRHNLEWAYFCQMLLSGIIISLITIEVAGVSI